MKRICRPLLSFRMIKSPTLSSMFNLLLDTKTKVLPRHRSTICATHRSKCQNNFEYLQYINHRPKRPLGPAPWCFIANTAENWHRYGKLSSSKPSRYFQLIPFFYEVCCFDSMAGRLNVHFRTGSV